MSSIIHSDVDKNLLTKDKYHILFICHIDEDGYCESIYRDKSLEMYGGVGGDSFQKMYDEAYESLKAVANCKDNVPFDINNIKESVVFDLVKCYTTDEFDMALSLKDEKKTYTEINDVILG
jgi:hypothetical protein